MNLSSCLLWEISVLRIRSSLAPMGTAFSSRRVTLPSSRKRTSMSPLTRRRLNPPPPRKADTGLTAPRRGKSMSSHKVEESCRAEETGKTEESQKTSLLTMAFRLHQQQKVIQGEANPYSQGEASLLQV